MLHSLKFSKLTFYLWIGFLLLLFMCGFGDVVAGLDLGVAVQLLLRHNVPHEVLGHAVRENKNRLKQD